MKGWQQYIDSHYVTTEILEKYLEMRLLLKELGYTEESLKKVSSGPTNLWLLREQLVEKVQELKKQIEYFGFEITLDEMTSYLMPKFNKINELTPLNDGNN